jgi:hypothetical protein
MKKDTLIPLKVWVFAKNAQNTDTAQQTD